MSIVLRFFPNGEFSHGTDTSLQRRDKKRRDVEFKPPLDTKRRDAYLQWVADNEKLQKEIDAVSLGSVWMSHSGNRYEVESLNLDSCTLGWKDKRGKKYSTVVPQGFRSAAFLFRLTPLVHQSVESYDKPESRKKLMSMTRSMSRNIRNAVYLLEQQSGGKDVLSFLTLTLPALSADGLRLCCENWDKMVKQFLDWLRVTLQRKHIEFQYVYCTEIQTKRLEIRHEYAPHLHLIFTGRNGKKDPWVITPKQARKAWKRCIASVVNESFADNALENLQRIKFSAARYLSKYISKGKCNIPVDSNGTPATPLRTQWGGISRTLSRRIRQFTTRIAGSSQQSELAFQIIADMEQLIRQNFVGYYKRGFIALGFDKTTGLEYGLHIGCGCLRTPSYEGGLIPVIEFSNRHIERGSC